MREQATRKRGAGNRGASKVHDGDERAHQQLIVFITPLHSSVGQSVKSVSRSLLLNSLVRPRAGRARQMATRLATGDGGALGWAGRTQKHKRQQVKG